MDPQTNQSLTLGKILEMYNLKSRVINIEDMEVRVINKKKFNVFIFFFRVISWNLIQDMV